MRRYELTDLQWSVIADLFAPTRMGRPRRDDRTILNAIFWVLCSGASWRDLPERFGPWQTAYSRFQRWQRAGLFDALRKRLHLRLDAQGLIELETWMADATYVRVSRAGTGARKKGARPRLEPRLRGTVAAG